MFFRPRRHRDQQTVRQRIEAQAGVRGQRLSSEHGIDPQVLGGDVIVVGFDQVKGVFRDIFKTAPFFYVFRYF